MRIPITCLSSLLGLSALLISAHVTSASPNLNETKKLQAKIILETKSFDLEGKSLSDLGQVDSNEDPGISTEKPQQVQIIDIKAKSVKPKTSRRLSNIWSMLIPSSSGGNDYDESFEAESGAQSNVDPDQTSSSSDLSTPTINSTRLEPSKAGNVSGLTSDENFWSTNRSPERFMSGQLMKDVNVASGGLGDFVSSVFNGTAGPDIHPVGEREREDETVSRDQSNPKISETTGDVDSGSFDRWLKKIQFQESSTRNPMQNLEHRNSSKPQRKPESMDSTADIPAEMRPNRQYSPNWHQTPHVSTADGVKGGEGSNSRPFQISRLPTTTKHQRTLSKPYTHPFQQQLVQHQAQLIHGIKYPTALESSISMSAQDGASNTSLAFTQVIPSTNTPPFGSEVSTVVTNTSTNQSKDNGSERNAETNYPSQDEILRQVTSAINLDQQQMISNKKSDDANNHRKITESSSDSPTSIAGEMDSESPNELAKFFKLTESDNNQQNSRPTEITHDMGSRLTPTESMKVKSGDRRATAITQSSSGETEVDKSSNVLADRLRLLAMHQQQLQTGSNSSGPSWIQRPASQLAPLNLGDGLNAEILAKLLNTRTPIKPSEEPANRNQKDQKVASLLHQLMLLEDLKANKSLGNNNDADKEHSNEDSGDQSNENQSSGWSPLKNPSSIASTVPISPANLMKNRVNSPPRSWNSKDKQSQSQADHPRIPIDLIPPIAANDDEFELSRDQFEAAALAAANKLGNGRDPQIQGNLVPERLLLAKQNAIIHPEHEDTNKMVHLRPNAQLLPEMTAIGHGDEINVGNDMNPSAMQHFNPNIGAETPSRSHPSPSRMNQVEKNQARPDELKLHRQSQHLSRPQSVLPGPAHQRPSAHMQLHQSFQPPYYPQGQQVTYGPPTHMINTITQGGGPPIRLREVSLYRPFGFQSHHAITYQPSPAMSALFPGLNDGRPSLLRHIKPFRSKFSESQRFVSPFINPFTNSLQEQSMYPHHYMSPSSPMVSSTSIRPIHNSPPNHNPYYDPTTVSQYRPYGHYQGSLKRRSKPDSIRWPAKGRVRVRNLDDDEEFNFMPSDFEPNVLSSDPDMEHLSNHHDTSHPSEMHHFSDPQVFINSDVIEPDDRAIRPLQAVDNWNRKFNRAISHVDQPSSGPLRNCNNKSIQSEGNSTILTSTMRPNEITSTIPSNSSTTIKPST